jgi:phage terminase large subunit GpA-like protein
MYDFVLAYEARRIYATKGYAGKGGTPIVGKPSEKTYGKKSRPVRLYPLNVDDAKADILSGLSLQAPGPGYIHFPGSVDEEFFAQLCAEHKETRYNKSNVATHTVWVQDRDRNEGLDTAVLALAAFRLLNPNLRQMAAAIAAAAIAPKPDAPVTPTSAPAAPAAAQRRVGHSQYLKG